MHSGWRRSGAAARALCAARRERKAVRWPQPAGPASEASNAAVVREGQVREGAAAAGPSATAERAHPRTPHRRRRLCPAHLVSEQFICNICNPSHLEGLVGNVQCTHPRNAPTHTATRTSAHHLLAPRGGRSATCSAPSQPPQARAHPPRGRAKRTHTPPPHRGPSPLSLPHLEGAGRRRPTHPHTHATLRALPRPTHLDGPVGDAQPIQPASSSHAWRRDGCKSHTHLEGPVGDAERGGAAHNVVHAQALLEHGVKVLQPGQVAVLERAACAACYRAGLGLGSGMGQVIAALERAACAVARQ